MRTKRAGNIMSEPIARATAPRAPARRSQALEAGAERLSDAAGEAMAATVDMVKARPIMMASFALGLGYLIGAACRAGRRS